MCSPLYLGYMILPTISISQLFFRAMIYFKLTITPNYIDLSQVKVLFWNRTVAACLYCISYSNNSTLVPFRRKK